VFHTLRNFITLKKNQLSEKEKIKLTKELEKDVINTKLSQPLKAFKTKDLDNDK